MVNSLMPFSFSVLVISSMSLSQMVSPKSILSLPAVMLFRYAQNSVGLMPHSLRLPAFSAMALSKSSIFFMVCTSVLFFVFPFGSTHIRSESTYYQVNYGHKLYKYPQKKLYSLWRRVTARQALSGSYVLSAAAPIF